MTASAKATGASRSTRSRGGGAGTRGGSEGKRRSEPFRDLRLPIRRVELSPYADPLPPNAWPATVPAVAQLLRDGLDLGPATVFVGENGTGKSTLVEAIAMAFGLNAEGGSTGANHRTYASESGLSECLLLRRGAASSKWGFFLRAETMHSFFTYLHRNPGGDPDFHALSHGESFNALLDSSRFRGDGLFVLDEPESALSFGAELRLLGQLMEMSASGSAQIILSTHSPVLASFPGARVLELGDWGWRETRWADLEVVSHYRSFLDSPERYLRHLR